MQENAVAMSLLINFGFMFILVLINRLIEKRCKMYAEEAERFHHATSKTLEEIMKNINEPHVGETTAQN